MKKEKINARFWWKDFLTGVTATAIGVGLSFAVNNMVENHKKDQARRLTAMMAVYDIDEITRHLKEERQKEDIYYKVAMYMATHQEEIDSSSVDSLRMAVTYLAEDLSEVADWEDDSKEKAFNSSMDAWQNLENTRFYDNVQTCYRRRSELKKTMEKDLVFKRPLSDNDFNDFFLQVKDSELDYNGSLNATALAKLIKQVLQQPTATRYLRTFFLRDALYNKCIDDLFRLNQENKFMMDFTEKDIEEYKRTNVDKTRPATVKKLIGEWVESQDENHTEVFCLNSDKTATLTGSAIFNMSIYVQEEDVTIPINCPITYHIDGTWDMVSDSLKMDFDAETSEILSVEMDLSNLPKTAFERERDSLDTMNKHLENQILKYIRSSEWSVSNKVSLDMTGNIMFWTSQQTTPWGQVVTEQQQLMRNPRRRDTE